MNNYYRADERQRRQQQVSRQQVRQEVISRQRPQTQIRQEQRPTANRRGYEEQYEDYYEEEQYTQRPSQSVRQTTARQPVVQTPRPVYREPESAYCEEEQPPQRISRRGLISKALIWGGPALLVTVLGANDYTTNQKLSADTTKYGDGSMPPTAYTTAVVGHNNDSPTNPSHFTVQNQNGHVLVFELPAGDPTKTIVYVGYTLMGVGASQASVALNFAKTTNSGLLDMQINTGGQIITFANNGTRFVPPTNPGSNVNS